MGRISSRDELTRPENILGSAFTPDALVRRMLPLDSRVAETSCIH